MAMGSVGTEKVFYVEIEILKLGSSSILIGVGRPGLDVCVKHAQGTADFWGWASGSGAFCHNGWNAAWGERNTTSPFRQGDTLGLLLDCRSGKLMVYKKGAWVRVDGWYPRWDSSAERMTWLGVAAEGMTDELCWAAALSRQEDSLRIAAKPPPLGWREAIDKVAAAVAAELAVEAAQEAEQRAGEHLRADERFGSRVEVEASERALEEAERVTRAAKATAERAAEEAGRY